MVKENLQRPKGFMSSKWMDGDGETNAEEAASRVTAWKMQRWLVR